MAHATRHVQGGGEWGAGDAGVPSAGDCDAAGGPVGAGVVSGGGVGVGSECRDRGLEQRDVDDQLGGRHGREPLPGRGGVGARHESESGDLLRAERERVGGEPGHGDVQPVGSIPGCPDPGVQRVGSDGAVRRGGVGRGFLDVGEQWFRRDDVTERVVGGRWHDRVVLLGAGRELHQAGDHQPRR